MLKEKYFLIREKTNNPIADTIKTLVLIIIAYIVSGTLLRFSGDSNNTALIYILAVIIVSRLTNGYIYGIIASVISVLSTNYFFMYPFSDFNFTITGYPIALLSMLAASVIVCTMTTQIKMQTEQAIEREKHAKELYELNQRLAVEQAEIKIETEKEKSRANLLRAISHDLRTPLTAIWGASSAILEKGKNLNQRDNLELVANIKEDSEWLIRMVENLLSITKINADNTKLNKKLEVIEEIVAEAVSKIKNRFPGRKIKITVPENMLEVPMDAMLIEQVIINLLENAIRHSGDCEDISLIVTENGEFATFEVNDKGKGIKVEELQGLLEGTARIDRATTDSSRGTGIGLSVCNSIIKVHGGFFEAGNNSDRGAYFRFALPIKG